MKRFILASAAAASIALLGSAPAMAVTVAQEPAPTVVAADTTPAITQVLANRVNALTVISPVGGLLAAKSSGHATRTVQAKAGQPVTMSNLDPGVRYTITLNGNRIGFGLPVSQVGPATGLRVETTDKPGEVQLSWSHTASRGEGVVHYTASATAVNERAPGATSIVSDLHTTLTGLDLNQRYTFTVTPMNTASTGRASTATMQQTLAQLSGVLVEQPAAQPVQVTPTAAPAPSAPPAPAPAPSPATRTIYVCPDGFADTGSTTCSKTLPYTYHQVTTTSPYTYHQAFIQTGSHVDYSSSPNGGTYYAQDQWNPNDGSPAGYYAVVPDGYYASVKDAPPAGYTDSGTNYVKTEQVLDPAPAGYTDSGSAWVMTVPKIAQQVPA